METYGYTNHPNQPHQKSPYRSEKKIAAALLGIFLNVFAANKLFMGYHKEAIIQILANIFTCGIATIIPFIEGIIYLTMSDEQFDNTYIKNRKSWF